VYSLPGRELLECQQPALLWVSSRDVEWGAGDIVHSVWLGNVLGMECIVVQLVSPRDDESRRSERVHAVSCGNVCAQCE